jgi:hypothetical protein
MSQKKLSKFNVPSWGVTNVNNASGPPDVDFQIVIEELCRKFITIFLTGISGTQQ